MPASFVRARMRVAASFGFSDRARNAPMSRAVYLDKGAAL
jgi:hypothetical protein